MDALCSRRTNAPIDRHLEPTPSSIHVDCMEELHSRLTFYSGFIIVHKSTKLARFVLFVVISGYFFADDKI
jgi:hypothetical protein